MEIGHDISIDVFDGDSSFMIDLACSHSCVCLGSKTFPWPTSVVGNLSVAVMDWWVLVEALDVRWMAMPGTASKIVSNKDGSNSCSQYCQLFGKRL